jgi:hypothetical protein
MSPDRKICTAQSGTWTTVTDDGVGRFDLNVAASISGKYRLLHSLEI